MRHSGAPSPLAGQTCFDMNDNPLIHAPVHIHGACKLCSDTHMLKTIPYGPAATYPGPNLNTCPTSRPTRDRAVVSSHERRRKATNLRGPKDLLFQRLSAVCGQYIAHVASIPPCLAVCIGVCHIQASEHRPTAPPSCQYSIRSPPLRPARSSFETPIGTSVSASTVVSAICCGSCLTSGSCRAQIAIRLSDFIDRLGQRIDLPDDISECAAPAVNADTALNRLERQSRWSPRQRQSCLPRSAATHYEYVASLFFSQSFMSVAEGAVPASETHLW